MQNYEQVKDSPFLKEFKPVKQTGPLELTVVCDTSMVKAQVDMIVEEVKALEQKHDEAMKLIESMTDYLNFLVENSLTPGGAAKPLLVEARKMLLNT